MCYAMGNICIPLVELQITCLPLIAHGIVQLAAPKETKAQLGFPHTVMK